MTISTHTDLRNSALLETKGLIAGFQHPTGHSSRSRDLMIDTWTFPLPQAKQLRLIRLWRCEWTETDFDWLHAMNGDYGRQIVFQAIVGLIGNRIVATATLIHARQRPRVALLASVVTEPGFRGHGIASRLILYALDRAVAVGCTLCYLGTTARSRNVYQRHGFTFWNGNVMRRVLKGGDETEVPCFEPDRPVCMRPAHWGDMPDFVHLTVQPCRNIVIDYPRGLICGRVADLDRCVSRFPVVWDDVTSHGGIMTVLADQQTDQVLGYATFTPGPAPTRHHTGVIDVMTHDYYQAKDHYLIENLLSQCKDRGIQTVSAYVASGDDDKFRSMTSLGFRPVSQLADAIRIADRLLNVTVFEKHLVPSS